MPTQSADLKANLVRVGLNYRWGGADAASAYADTGSPMAVKESPLVAPVWNKSDWEFDVGTRTWWSGGVMGATNPLLSDTQHLKSRLIWADLDALSGETYGRVDHVSGWFVKGFLGAGGIYNGKLNDEDFPESPGSAYSNTYSSSTGSLGYATIDLGYSLLNRQAPNLAPSSATTISPSTPMGSAARKSRRAPPVPLLFRTTSSFRRMLASTRCASVSQPNSC